MYDNTNGMRGSEHQMFRALRPKRILRRARKRTTRKAVAVSTLGMSVLWTAPRTARHRARAAVRIRPWWL